MNAKFVLKNIMKWGVGLAQWLTFQLVLNHSNCNTLDLVLSHLCTPCNFSNTLFIILLSIPLLTTSMTTFTTKSHPCSALTNSVYNSSLPYSLDSLAPFTTHRIRLWTLQRWKTDGTRKFQKTYPCFRLFRRHDFLCNFDIKLNLFTILPCINLLSQNIFPLSVP